ncbi:MAG TPA: MerR family transcriptional regulator [Candidatus Limnocylindrales bacterium]|nr:MerR family transcriptional regulator [Candidatus Limnocylindrales bacterium]
MSLRLTIGDFSRMTQLSVKALRHYHEIGLLEPVAVDPGSGYRLYDVEQVPVAQVIRRLKDLGMGLDDVKRVLEAPDLGARNRAIVEHLQRLESQLDQTKANVASLRRLLESPEGLEQRVEFRSLPETRSIAITERVTTQGLDAWWSDAFEELHSLARRARVTRAGPDGALYGSQWFEDEVGDVVAFVPVASDVDLRRGGRAELIAVPAAELAVLLHAGPLRDIDRTFAALGEFVAERAIGVEGPMREYYLVTAFDTADEMRHRTEVAWPVFQTALGS